MNDAASSSSASCRSCTASAVRRRACRNRRRPGWSAFTPGSTVSGPGSATSFAPSSRPTRAIRFACGAWARTQPPKKGPQVDEYAQVPVLNQQQVVSEWKWTVPPGERWQSQNVTVPVSDKGVYLVEATNGTLRAYTIVVVTEIAVITKAAPGRLLSFVVDRHTGDPIAGATDAGLDRSAGDCQQADRPAGLDGLPRSRRTSPRTSRCSRATRTSSPSTLPARGTWAPARSQSARLHLHRPPGVSSRRHGALQDHRSRRDAQWLHDSAGPRAYAWSCAIRAPISPSGSRR